MEENQNGLNEAAPSHETQAAEASADLQSYAEEKLTDELTPEEDALLAQEAPDEEEMLALPDEPLCFDFGAAGASEKERKKTGKIAFFAIFGGVLLLCLSLLALVLFTGSDGIRIFKTLHTERVVYVREDDGTSGLLTAQETADVMRRSTVTISIRTATTSGVGSGFVYDNNGHICTNYHVIEDAVSVQVVLPNGEAVDAEVVGYDAPSDLAVLRVQAEGLVPVTLGSSASLLVGDEVVAVGTPASTMFSGSATFGRVSYARRLLPVDDNGDGVYEKKLLVIQTDTSVNPGNSGGPMADMYGRVVGVVVRKITSYNGSIYEGIGFAIPIDGARIILDAIIKDGSFTGENPVIEGRSLLGISGFGGAKGKWYYVDPLTNKVTVSDEEREGYMYMPADGVLVSGIINVNAKNKLFAGDVIYALNGLTVRNTEELIDAVNCYPCGEIVKVYVWRNGEQVVVDICLAEE